MNAGLSNLAQLKAWLLAPGLVASTEYDQQILTIGRGVAAQLERHCDRKFARTVDDVFECTANREHVVLERYPVEVVTKVEQKDSGDDWAEVTDLVQTEALDRGMLYFGWTPGTYLSRLRFTYTGGYFFEQEEPPATEEEETSYPTEQPEGSTALDADILLAWKLQCEHVWTQRDKLGVALAKEQSASSSLSALLPLLDSVKDYLRPHVRYSLQ